MIGGYRVGHGLQHHRLASARRRIDEPALAFADRAEQVKHAPSHILLGGFHLEAALWIERRQVIKENLVARDFRVFKIDRFDFNQCEISFTIFRRAYLAGDGVAGAQVELADLRWRNVDVVRAGKVVVFRSTQKSESIGETFEDAFGEDQAVLFSLRPQDLKDQLLLAHAARARNV